MFFRIRTAPVLIALFVVVGAVLPLTNAGASGLIPQTITFADGINHMTVTTDNNSPWWGLSTGVLGGASGNPVVFTVDPSSTSGCTLSSYTFNSTVYPDTVYFSLPLGTCIIDANQAGNATYAPAAQKQYFLYYSLPQQLLNIDIHVPTLYVGMTYTFTDTDYPSNTGNPIVFSRGPGSTSGCVVSPNGFTTFKAPSGWCNVVINQSGGHGYAPSDQTSWGFMVHPSTGAVGTTTTSSPVTGTTSHAKPISIVITYSGESIGLTTKSRLQLSILAHNIKRSGDKSVSVSGFVNQGGSVSSSTALSRREASAVASYLKGRLAALGVRGVTFAVSSDGATSPVAIPPTSLKNRRTQVVASA